MKCSVCGTEIPKTSRIILEGGKFRHSDSKFCAMMGAKPDIVLINPTPAFPPVVPPTPKLDAKEIFTRREPARALPKDGSDGIPPESLVKECIEYLFGIRETTDDETAVAISLAAILIDYDLEADKVDGTWNVEDFIETAALNGFIGPEDKLHSKEEFIQEVTNPEWPIYFICPNMDPMKFKRGLILCD